MPPADDLDPSTIPLCSPVLPGDPIPDDDPGEAEEDEEEEESDFAAQRRQALDENRVRLGWTSARSRRRRSNAVLLEALSKLVVAPPTAFEFEAGRELSDPAQEHLSLAIVAVLREIEMMALSELAEAAPDGGDS